MWLLRKPDGPDCLNPQPANADEAEHSPVRPRPRSGSHDASAPGPSWVAVLSSGSISSR